MKKIIALLIFISAANLYAQNDSSNVYKKRVLESTEIDFLSSYYSQDGNNAAVTGGIGTEKLTDITPTLIISIPLNADNVLTIDAGISAYTSASSSNLDPFDKSGASAGMGEDDDGDDDDDEEFNGYPFNPEEITGSPWVASSGASRKDTWTSAVISYAHSSDDRNSVWSANMSFATEYDYNSFGFGGGLNKLFNDKNTEIGINASVYLDQWLPKYPTELDTYVETGGDLNAGFFNGIPIWDQQGNLTDNTGNSGPIWSPIEGFDLIQNKGRNTGSLSLSFSQILSKNAQMSIFMDVVQQTGWLANPMQRVYFKDVDNYYIGNSESIQDYTSSTNTDVFQLADDIERLPDTRLKLPIGIRLNYFINQTFALRTYYRYYSDDWGLNSNTISVELPIKISQKFTVYPSYRYYDQTQADYFAPFEEHLSTSEFYTSDFDLSKFNANQFGVGVSYTDVFTKTKLWKIGLKSIDVKYNNYQRNTGLQANYFGLGVKFVVE